MRRRGPVTGVAAALVPAARTACETTRERASNNFLAVVAVFDDGAALADGVARAAELAAVADEVDVERVEFAGGHEAVHDLVGEAVGALRRDEAGAAEHAEDVRVEREDLRRA